MPATSRIFGAALRNIAAAIAALLAVPTGSLAADAAAGFPARPIRVVIGFSPGGVVDVTARIIGQKLGEAWKQQVIADNRPGAGGIIAAQLAATANPDGYTLLSVSAAHVIAPALYAKVPYETLKDFAAVRLTAIVPNVLVVSPGIGIKSVRDLVAAAKAKPGALLYSSGGVGSGTHFSAELLTSLTAISVSHVPFKGIPEALTEVATGRVQFTLSPVSTVLPFAQNGKVIALGVTTATRSAAMPDVPTLAEAGVVGYQWDPWFGILAPARTPRPIVKKLSDEMGRIIALPEVKERWSAMGADATPPTALDAFDRYLAEQVAVTGRLAKAANMKPE